MILLNLFVSKVELPTKNIPAAVRHPTTIDDWTAEEASEEIAGALTVSLDDAVMIFRGIVLRILFYGFRKRDQWGYNSNVPQYACWSCWGINRGRKAHPRSAHPA